MTFIDKDLKLAQSSKLYQNEPLINIVKRFLKDFLKGNIIRILLAILFMVGTGLATSATAYLIKPMTNNVIADTGLKQVYYVGFGFIIIFLIKGICTYLSGYILNTVSFTRAFEMQKRLHKKLLHQDVAYYSASSSGQTAPVISMSGMDGLSAFFATIFGAVRNLITVLSLAFYMMFESLQYFLFACILVIAFYFPFKFINSMVKNALNKQVGAGMQFNDTLLDFIKLFSLIKSYNLENHQYKTLTKSADSLLKLKLKVSRKSNLLSPLMETAGGLFIGGVIIFTGTQAIKNSADIGQVFAMVTAVLLIYQPIKMLLNSLLGTSVASIGVRLHYSLMDTDFVLQDKGTEKINKENTTIEVKNVSFSYGNKQVVSDINITIPQGKKVALVGESGAGKSTIAKLLMKFAEADKGSILIGGKDIANISTTSLRQNISFVGQEMGLFNSTVLENIKLGKQDATLEEVIEAAKKSYAHDFIQQLPQGYDTPIIENGGNLSGGQRQRIAIARAILKNSPIIIFDEPTSALDNESEDKIGKAIKNFTSGKTMVTIAHRLSTIQNSDIIYAMKDGKVVESGKHDELIAKKSYYYELYNMQFKNT